MKENELPFDRSKHVSYTKKAKKCVLKLLHRYNDKKTVPIRGDPMGAQLRKYQNMLIIIGTGISAMRVFTANKPGANVRTEAVR